MRCGAAAAVVIAALGACEKAPTPSASPAPATATPSAATTVSECTDEMIAKQLDDSFAAIERYFGAIEQRLPGWTDCERARADLVALAPEAARFATSVTTMKTWGESLGSSCRDRVQQLGPGHPRAAATEARFDPLGPAVEAVIERCTDHPGFQAAVQQGLRVLRKNPR